jgi:hypothetical protein
LNTESLPSYSPVYNARGSDPVSSLDRLANGGGPSFTAEEEEMYRSLMRDHDARSRRAEERRRRAHVSAYTHAADMLSSEDELVDINGTIGDLPAAGRSTFASRVRSRSVPRSARDREADRAEWEERAGRFVRRAKDDTDVNLNLKVNLDAATLRKMKELDLFPPCAHSRSSLRPHDSRACKICQRRAFGRGADDNVHYSPTVHVKRGAAALKHLREQLPHT